MAEEAETPNVKAPSVTSSGQMGKNIKLVTDTITDAEKRKHFMTHEDMEPHRHLAILLGLTVLITLLLALFSPTF